MKNISRSKKLFLNGFSGLTKEVASVICSMILPRCILLYFGSELNGLVSSIGHFLSFISFLDMGVSAVVISNLYRPLADKDNLKLSMVVASARKFFRNIAKVLLIYVAVLCIIYPHIAASSYSYLFVVSLILILSASQFAKFYFGITNQLVIAADQRSYIYINFITFTQILHMVVCVALMKMGCSIHIMKLAGTAVFITRPIFYGYYVRHHYEINKNVVYEHEPIRQKWNGLIQHTASVVNRTTDIVILSVLSSLKDVSVYSVYYLVVSGVETILMAVVSGLEALWGNMIAKGEKKILKKSFEQTEWIIHNAVVLLFVLAGLLIIPFIKLYTKGIQDANYIRPVFAVLMTSAFAVECVRIPYFRMIKAQCHFKETQIATLVQPIVNLVLSVVLVIGFGMVGVAIGTLCSMIYHTIYVAWYCNKIFFEQGMKRFWKYVFIDIIMVLLMIVVAGKFNYEVKSYFDWLILAVVYGIICLIIVFVVNIVMNRKIMSSILLERKRK